MFQSVKTYKYLGAATKSRNRTNAISLTCVPSNDSTHPLPKGSSYPRFIKFRADISLFFFLILCKWKVECALFHLLRLLRAMFMIFSLVFEYN